MFLAHGEWKISIKDNYVLQWFSGYWNEEAAIEYSQEFLEMTPKLTGKPWAIISFLGDWNLAIPEAESHLIEHNKRLKNNGCSHHCQIFMPSTWKSMQLEQFSSQNDVNYERRTFDDNASAILWLQSNGFSIEIDELLSSLPIKYV